MENIGGAGRSIGDGIAIGIGQGMPSLEQLGGAINSAGSAAATLSSIGKSAGGEISGAMAAASSSVENLDKSLDGAQSAAQSVGQAGDAAGDRIRESFKNAAGVSDSLGNSFAKNFTKAIGAGKSFGTSIKTGLTGAFDTAKKKAESFIKTAVDGAKKTGNAFLHPIQTIKNKFSDTMKSAAKSVDKVGDEAKKTDKSLAKMGSSGSSAGDRIQKGLGAALKVVAAIAAAAVVFTGLAKFATAAMNASQAAETVAYSFDKTFGDSAPDVEIWANSKAIKRSETEVKSFLSANKQLYEGMGVTGEAANDLSKITTSLAFDLGNVAGISDADALSQIQDAISGNEKALSSYGVKLDNTKLKQTAMAMGLGDNIDSMNEATLAQVRLNAILEQTGDIQQNASKSLGGFAGGVKALQATWTGFLEKAGEKLAPTFDKLFGVILDAWPKIEPVLMNLVDMLAEGFSQAVPIVVDFATNLLPQLFDIISDLGPVIGDIAIGLLPLFSDVLGTVIQAIKPLMPLISTLIETLLPPLANLFGVLVKALLPPLATLFGALTPIIDALSPAIEASASWIGFLAECLGKLIEWLAKGIGKVGEFAQAIKNSAVGKFVSGISDGFNKASGAIAGHAKGTDNFEGGWTKINEAGGEIIQAKHGAGVAYLPQGSAVIPASKTDEILSDKKPRWIPQLVEGISYKSQDPPDEPDPQETDGGGAPKSPPPPPPASDAVIRKVIEIKVTVSSPDGTVPNEALDQIRRLVREEYQQMKDDELENLAIQEGLVG